MVIPYKNLDFANLQNQKFDLYSYPYESPIEKILGEMLEKYTAGSPAVILPQVEIQTTGGLFILDFLVVINGRKYAVECDGKEYHGYYPDLYRDAMLLCEEYINEMVRFSGKDLNAFPHACALFLGKLIPGLVSAQHLYALDMEAKNERWTKTEHYDPEGERFNEDVFDEDVSEIQEDHHFWGIDMTVTCRHDRLKKCDSVERLPDWVKAYIFVKQNGIKNRDIFVEKYPARYDRQQISEKNNDDEKIPF